MPDGKYSRKVYGLPKIKSTLNKEKIVLIKTSERKKVIDNENNLNSSPYGKMTNLIGF
jgi:hypothetical protein